jgi:hypothetical protein
MKPMDERRTLSALVRQLTSLLGTVALLLHVAFSHAAPVVSVDVEEPYAVEEASDLMADTDALDSTDDAQDWVGGDVSMKFHVTSGRSLGRLRPLIDAPSIAFRDPVLRPPCIA